MEDRTHVFNRDDIPLLGLIACATVTLVFTMTEVRGLRRAVLAETAAATARSAAVESRIRGVERALSTPEPMPARWEYRVESPSDYGIVASLNELGRDGWEVVSARRARDPIRDVMSYEMILRRQVPSAAPAAAR